tara:strand:+ start:6107 stop:7387 length:1281 start_codon:yes stop_codon:yes gene_type:complete
MAEILGNQGYRKDLNLFETQQESEVINNLGGAGIADDLRIIQNNLRNTSKIGFCTITSDGFFSGKNGTISKIIEAVGDNTFSPSRIRIKLDPPHHVQIGHQIEIKNVTGTGNTFFNGFHYVNRIFNDGEEYEMILSDETFTPPATANVGTSSTVRILPKDEFVFTNDDVVGLSTNITFTGTGATTLTVGREYYVCDSDGFSDFKLSYFPSNYSFGSQVGIQTINVNGLNSSSKQFFNFVRKNPVTQENIINFIEPERDGEEQGSFIFFRSQNDPDVSGGLNETFVGISSLHDETRVDLVNRYEKTKDISSNKDIKYEGSVSIKDPDNFNTGTAKVDNPKSPGVFIAGTRAFSADNNPWDDENSSIPNAIVTKSEEVGVGEITFDDDIRIDGLGSDIETFTGTAGDYTHKIPVVVNGETYFLLLVEN